MAYVESFTRAMERARQSVSYWDRKTLDHLQAAHDAEMRQCSKSEYHRGFEDGRAIRDADQWQLERERKAVAERLQAVKPSELCGSHESLSAICKAIQEPVMGWTMDACESLRDRLIYLLGGKSTNNGAETSAKVIQNGEKYQLATDVLGNERHKVVCRLRGFEPRNGGKPTEEASKLIRCIIGREDCHVACGNDLEEARDRLIALLGTQDAPNATDFARNQQNGPKSGKKQPEMQRDESKSRDSLQEVQSPSITDELRDYLDKNGQEYESFGGAEVATIKGGTTPLYEIADRIDEQFERICSQHESVLQQTIGDTVDEHEREMADLRADYERTTKMQREYGEKVADLRASKAWADPAGVFVRFEEIG